MIATTPEAFRKELGFLDQRLLALKEEYREHGMLSDADQAVLDRVQREKDRLALRLDAERAGSNWDLIRHEFEQVWNSFIVDLELLEVRLMDAESTKARRA